MDDTVSDILQCEEQLRITLHCDDKEKLRKKLLYLQKEYQRTAQRLQRAERSEAVKRCVRSRTTEQCHQKNQGEQEVGGNPSDEPSLQSLTTANAPDVVHQHNEHAGDSKTSRGEMLRSLLPLKAAHPQTPISIPESASGHKPTPSLRLRSRRSRLRWERQSSAVGVNADSSQDGQEQAEMVEPAAAQTTNGDKIEPAEVVDESEELISGADSESPSLLLPLLSASGQHGASHGEENARQEGPERRDKEIKVTVEAGEDTQPALLACESLIQTEETGTLSQREAADLEPSKDGRMENVDKIEEDGRECDDNNPGKEDEVNTDGVEGDTKEVGLLDSCTLVEGLLFPAEYYVRTTRRMTSSQRQPDMQAVILSQLNVGRPRGGRGGGRRLPHNRGSHSQTAESGGPWSKSQEAEAVSAARPAGGRKRRRGRGRAGSHSSQRSLSPDTRPLGCERTSDHSQLTSSPVLVSPSPAEEPKAAGPVAGEQLLTSTAADPQASGTKDSPGYPNYPIFLKNSNRRDRSSQLSGSQSLAVPSPLAPPPLPLPSLSLRSFIKNLTKFDVLQDFHLPDDQFASLKLHKLRQVAVETGAEPFSSPSYCTRRSARRHVQSPSCVVATPLPVSSDSTPTVASPRRPICDGCEEGGAGLTDCPEETWGLTPHTGDRTDPGPGPDPVLRTDPPAPETETCSQLNTCPGGGGDNLEPSLPSILSHLRLSPALGPALLTTPRLPSSSLASSPPLPSLGVTPQAVPAALPLTSSPSAPTLILPPPHSPSTQAMSPPLLSPCPSLPPSPLQVQVQVQVSRPLVLMDGPAKELPVSSVRSEGPEGSEEAEKDFRSCTHTLKTPSGGCLVDACCLPGPSGRLCVAAAGKWAVCLWTQVSASDWTLSHTWSFNEMVINVFAVPDAAGLICVTLGQLEIRDVRMLSCSSLSQVSLCDCLVQAVVGVSRSRVVTLSRSASGSALRVFTVSDSGSSLGSQPLASPGGCVSALSPVQGLPDALIGTDENERLFIWNLNSGQLLRKVHLEDGLSPSACLRGYSCCGVLFVLLQHQLLSSHQEGGGGEGKPPGQLSLVAINPLSGRSILATRLHPPSAWSGRLCEVDVSGCSVAGLSQNGCVCVWELGQRGATRIVGAPEGEGWQLARWGGGGGGGGGGGTLLTGHHNGDVTLHRCSRPV